VVEVQKQVVILLNQPVEHPEVLVEVQVVLLIHLLVVLEYVVKVLQVGVLKVLPQEKAEVEVVQLRLEYLTLDLDQVQMLQQVEQV
tara:strand:- start:134 stop:391 length:258 start_codon:yes stop_codon:yes gene_type:complete